MDREPSVTSAAVLLIGNELLSGKIRDQNGHELAKMMRRRGIRLVEMCTVEDDLAGIGEALLRLLARVPLVFTSGGVGPTHDDVTMEAIALAIGRPLRRDPDMERTLRAHFGERITEAALKMADLPEGTALTAAKGWPVMRIDLPAPASAAPGAQPGARRIYVLPGIPELCRAKIEALEKIPGELPDAGGWALETLHTEMDESDLAASLNRVVADYPDVEIGSYPRWLSGDDGRLRCVVRVTFEAIGAHAGRAGDARDALARALGDAAVLAVPEGGALL
ncbi:competence/damage-inducible protein A [Nannocystis radixulma]|uniref:Molybdopterin-binding protein n=1 Tax=Nannocystis radixulma TaxID=2995305 RepID=A0ABT5AZG5_9BACT|nr:molybdopterin-binding protein [Nannocystis radixulma]MDC0667224.1 molybdopterin-binding protein [Nannocystis radixulma]